MEFFLTSTGVVFIFNIVDCTGVRLVIILYRLDFTDDKLVRFGNAVASNADNSRHLLE